MSVGKITYSQGSLHPSYGLAVELAFASAAPLGADAAGAGADDAFAGTSTRPRKVNRAITTMITIPASITHWRSTGRRDLERSIQGKNMRPSPMIPGTTTVPRTSQPRGQTLRSSKRPRKYHSGRGAKSVATGLATAPSSGGRKYVKESRSPTPTTTTTASRKSWVGKKATVLPSFSGTGGAAI